MLRRFWEAACRGGYPGHGETYLNKENILWWSHGGILHGESHKRFGFLLDRLKETPGLGLMPYSRTWDEVCAVPQEITPGEAECGCKEYYRIYYSIVIKYKVFGTWSGTGTDHHSVGCSGSCSMSGMDFNV